MGCGVFGLGSLVIGIGLTPTRAPRAGPAGAVDLVVTSAPWVVP